ncbi:hypothetical protein B0H13DRAFT_2292810, partial [Mycena leptocephala]
MPLFTSASGFQINGGTFIDNTGDMTIVHNSQAMPGQDTGSLEFVADGPSRELPGVERNDRGFGATRMVPYDMLPAQYVSQRPQILNRTQNLSLLVANEDPWTTFVASGPSFSNSLPSTFLSQEHESNSQYHLGSLSTTSSSQDFTAGYHEQFHDSMNSMGSEHPMSSFAPVARDFSQISSSDNPFGLTLTGHVPNPLFTTEIFSEEMQPQFRPSLHLPTIVDVSNLGPFGELAPPVIGSIAGTNPRPLDDQSQEQRAINGGTFIGGNLNYIHTTVMPAGHWEANIYVLHGLGGAGKTQIGLKFINDSYRCIEVARNNQDWLLFYDNAMILGLTCTDLYPSAIMGILSSRPVTPPPCYAGAHFAVSDMEESDAVELLLKSASQEIVPANQEIAAKIVKELCYLPLQLYRLGHSSYNLEPGQLFGHLHEESSPTAERKPAQSTTTMPAQ